MKYKFDLVLARKNEDIAWASFITRIPNCRVFVYNDGHPIDDDVLTKGMIINTGDGFKTECGKYAKYIIDNYAALNEYTVFAHAYPFDHSPDFIGLLYANENWSDVQNLTYRAHKRSWGPCDDYFNEIPEFRKHFLSNFRIWEDEMNTEMQGKHWHGVWLKDIISKHVKIEHDEVIPYFAEKFGFEPPEKMRKAYSACFAVKKKDIIKYPREFYAKVLRWISSCDTDFYKHDDFSAYRNGIFMEYLWLVIFDGTPQ